MAYEWRFPLTYIDNYDGDTVKGYIDLGFALTKKDSIRLNGVDTPEIRNSNRLLKNAAYYVKYVVEEKLTNAEELILVSETLEGKYGRPIGDIEFDGESIVQYIIDNRLGVPYTSGSIRALIPQHIENAEYLVEQGLIERD